MKTIFLIGLLAALAAAYSNYTPNEANQLQRIHPSYESGPYFKLKEAMKKLAKESEPTTTTEFTLLGGKETLIEELKKFGRQLIVYSLNLKNYSCDKCFPVELHDLDVTNILAIKSVLQELYGTEYDRLIQEPNDIAKFEAEGVIEKQIAADLWNIMGIWNKTLSGLQISSDIRMQWPDYDLKWQRKLMNYFFKTFDKEKGLETQRRFYYVFGPVLNKTTTKESILSAEYDFMRSHQDNVHLVQSLLDISSKQQLEHKILKFINRLYSYVFDMDLQNKDYMTYYMKKLLEGMSQKTMMIFYMHLENDFGNVMKEIPEKMISKTERQEKRQIRDILKQTIIETMNVWEKDFSTLVDTKIRFHYGLYNKLFTKHVEYLAEMLSLEELREVFRKAMPILEMAVEHRP